MSAVCTPATLGPTDAEFRTYITRAIREGRPELVPYIIRYEAVRWPAAAAAALARFDGLPVPS